MDNFAPMSRVQCYVPVLNNLLSFRLQETEHSKSLKTLTSAEFDLILIEVVVEFIRKKVRSKPAVWFIENIHEVDTESIVLLNEVVRTVFVNSLSAF